MLVSSDYSALRREREKKAYLASFPELNPNPVLEVGSAGKITYLNAATVETLKTLSLEDNPNVFLPRDINEILDDLKQKKKKRLGRPDPRRKEQTQERKSRRLRQREG